MLQFLYPLGFPKQKFLFTVFSERLSIYTINYDIYLNNDKKILNHYYGVVSGTSTFSSAGSICSNLF